MDLNTQIITLVVSLLYGMVFSLFVNLNYKIIYHDKLYIKLTGSLLITLIGVLLYFVILRKINYGIFHPYCLIVLILGFWSMDRIVKRFKK